MAVTAPLQVPIEIRPEGGSMASGAGGRWFRTCSEISQQALYFPRPLPSEIGSRRLMLRFHLPLRPPESPLAGGEPVGDGAGIVEVEGRAVDVETGEVGERLEAIRFHRVDAPVADRIARYVEERVPY